MTLRNKVKLDDNYRKLLNDSLLDIEERINEEYPEAEFIKLPIIQKYIG